MSLTTEQKRTVEARLDRLRKRTAQAINPLDANSVAMGGVLRGTLDLIADVLLPAETENEP